MFVEILEDQPDRDDEFTGRQAALFMLYGKRGVMAGWSGDTRGFHVVEGHNHVAIE